MSVPPILRILAFVAVLAALNSRLPGLVPRILLLVAAYLVLTNGPKVAELIGAVPAGLSKLAGPPARRF